MSTLFALLFFFSLLALFVLIPIAIFSKKKNPDRSKKFFKNSKIAAIVTVVSFILFAIIDDTEPAKEQAKEPEKTEVTNVKEEEEATNEIEEEEEEVKEEEVKETKKEESPEEKAAREAKEKEVAEQKAKKDADAKAKKEADKLAAEKEYYLQEIDTKVTTQMGMYDAAWNEYWVTTFEGVGNGTVTVYTAYDNMKALEQRYDTLYSSFGAIEADGLSKENEKLFKDFRRDIKNAAMWRGKAAEKAQKMFDSGDVSPSKLDEIKKDVSFADNEMMTAVISLTQLQMNLGMIEGTEDAKE